MTPRRLLIVPRWAGRPTSDFYPWLLTTLRSEHPGRFAEVQVLDLPRPEQPDVAAWPAAISAALGSDPKVLANTYVLAHSVGCQALLRSLSQLPEGHKLAGALAVAGWFTIDKPWDSIRPWLEPVPALARARAALPALLVLLSDNDPFTHDAVQNQRDWEDRLGARVKIAPAALHFNAPIEPAVLAALLELTGPGDE
jgi:predicted alpha/beta hydrolase family esterase